MGKKKLKRKKQKEKTNLFNVYKIKLTCFWYITKYNAG